MATRKPKKKAAPKKAAKKATAKKAAKKTAKKKAAKKTAAKADASKKKAAGKKAAPKKAAKKKAAGKKKAAPKKAAKKKAAKKSAARGSKETVTRSKRTPAQAITPRPEREARRAKPDLPHRDADQEETSDLDVVEEADVIAIEEDDGDEESDDEVDEDFDSNGESVPRRTRPTSLPPDHEILDPGPLRGEPVDKGTVIEAIRAAFKADEEHPVRGREFLGARSPVDVPQEGEVDYARAVESQRAAAEVLARADLVSEERKAVDERIAEVYARDAWDSDE
jgi:hypothetical protein